MGRAGTYYVYVYILASGRHGTLYIGVTNNLGIRLEQHRGGRGSEFVKKYAAVVGWAKRERAHQLNFESEISGCWWARREGRLCPPYNRMPAFAGTINNSLTSPTRACRRNNSHKIFRRTVA
jgi:predicted GIY-YIG superfamily endonuclease